MGLNGGVRVYRFGGTGMKFGEVGKNDGIAFHDLFIC